MGAGQPATQTVPAIRRKLPAGIALAFACWLVMTGIRSAYAVLFPIITAEPGWNAHNLAAAFSVGVLLYAPGTLVAGFLIDRIGTRLPMLAGSGLIALSLGLIATATPATSWQMWVGWATAAGPGAALIGYTPIIKLLSVGSVENLGRTMGIAMMGQGASPLLIGPAVQALSDLRDWHVAVGVFAVIVLAVLLPLILTTTPVPPSRAASNAARFSLAPANEAAHPHAFWLFLFAFLCLGYLLLIPTYLVAYLIETGVAAYAAAVLAGVFGALNSIGGATGGGLADRWGFRRAAALGAMLMTAGSIALLEVTANPVWMLACYVIVAGIGRGIVGVAVTVAHTRTFSGHQFGRITGLLDVGFSVGASLGVWFTLVARDRLGNYTPSLVSTAVVCVAIALLVAVGASRSLAGRRLG
ncbi:MAG: MFS transporter [Chloroflexi bacterium]|nr:MFS transporter [Chloroflexota bacterium]